MKRLQSLVCPLLAAAGLALASGCATTDFVTGQEVQNMYSIDEEIQLGQEFYVETVKELKK